jgi:hypothetical protein
MLYSQRSRRGAQRNTQRSDVPVPDSRIATIRLTGPPEGTEPLASWVQITTAGEMAISDLGGGRSP